MERENIWHSMCWYFTAKDTVYSNNRYKHTGNLIFVWKQLKSNEMALSFPATQKTPQFCMCVLMKKKKNTVLKKNEYKNQIPFFKV